MMDLLKIKLSTKFMKGLVAKIISKRIYKQLGYKIDIQLNDVQIDVVDGDVQIHLDVELWNVLMRSPKWGFSSFSRYEQVL